MKVVMLAAGKSTRTYPLTLTRPKPLLKVANKTIIEHNLDQLQGIVKEAIIIVGYKAEMIEKHLGDKYKKIKLTYIEQKEQLGTGHALLQARDYLTDRFFVMNGDDLYTYEDIKRCLKHKFSILVQHLDTVHSFGAVTTNGNRLDRIHEKTEDIDLHLVNTGLYLVDDRIFDYTTDKSPRGEYEITDMINLFAQRQEVTVVETKDWMPIGYPWNLLDANAAILKNIKTNIKGKVAKGVTVHGNVIIGKGTVVKPHSHIEGPAIIGENCIIGPHAYIRPETSIGNNCKIRAELVDAIIMDNTTAKHHSYLGHSVVGENVNIAAGTITADYRHDAKDHVTLVNQEKVHTARKKLGAFIGDSVKTGINTCIYPGRKIWPNQTTLPGEIVQKDVQ